MQVVAKGRLGLSEYTSPGIALAEFFVSLKVNNYRHPRKTRDAGQLNDRVG
jgi:hypothetical protein